MQDQPRTLNPTVAVLVGTALVNVPVLALLIGPAILFAFTGLGQLVPLVLSLSFLLAWTWWSFSVPRWRLWAYERVPSTGAVYKRALAVGLIWPRGWLFERTEIKSAAHRAREQELERLFP